MACRAEPSFSSCFTLIFTISCRNFSLDSLESRPESSACLRLSSSDSRPSSGGVSGAATGGVAVAAAVGAAGWAGPSGDVTVQAGADAPPGELRSLAELLDEVKDGEDSEDSDDVTVGMRRDEIQPIDLFFQIRVDTFANCQSCTAATESAKK